MRIEGRCLVACRAKLYFAQMTVSSLGYHQSYEPNLQTLCVVEVPCCNLIFLELTKPEFIIQITKSGSVIFPVAEELYLAALASEEDLQQRHFPYK